jgi:hypothetical protein
MGLRFRLARPILGRHVRTAGEKPHDDLGAGRTKHGWGLRGIAYKGLNLSLLRSFLVPLPPLGEQQRIVAKVDELMRCCGDLEAGLQRAQSARASFATSAVASFA